MSQVKNVSVGGVKYSLAGASGKNDDRVIVHRALKQTSMAGSKYFFNGHVSFRTNESLSGFRTVGGYLRYLVTIPENWESYSSSYFINGNFNGLLSKMIEDGYVKTYTNYNEVLQGLMFDCTSPNFKVVAGKVVCIADVDAILHYFDSSASKSNINGISTLRNQAHHFGRNLYAKRRKYHRGTENRYPRIKWQFVDAEVNSSIGTFCVGVKVRNRYNSINHVYVKYRRQFRGSLRRWLELIK